MRSYDSCVRALVVACATMLATTLAGSATAVAQAYPSRPITMIVPFPPGGATDTIARIMSERLRSALGQPVIIENVGGAGGSIGVGRAVRAAPDGYTLNLGQLGSHVMNGAAYALTYDLLNDLDPVSLIAANPQVIVARSGLPVNNLKELIAWLKANPNKATWGIVGSGSPSHLCAVHFGNETGTTFQAVPYRGAGPVMQDLVGGQIDLSCLEASASRANIEGGRMKALALLTKSRWPAAPNVPTIDEAGLQGFYLPFWHALWVPAGTPAAVIGRLNAAAVEILADPAMRERLIGLGVELPTREQQTPEWLRAFHKAEIDKWRPIIEAANVKPE